MQNICVVIIADLLVVIMAGSEAIAGQARRQTKPNYSAEKKEICRRLLPHLVVLVSGCCSLVDLQVLLSDSACAHRLRCSQETWFVSYIFVT